MEDQLIKAELGLDKKKKKKKKMSPSWPSKGQVNPLPVLYDARLESHLTPMSVKHGEYSTITYAPIGILCIHQAEY